MGETKLAPLSDILSQFSELTEIMLAFLSSLSGMLMSNMGISTSSSWSRTQGDKGVIGSGPAGLKSTLA
jgi:hypothetical protein